MHYVTALVVAVVSASAMAWWLAYGGHPWFAGGFGLLAFSLINGDGGEDFPD